MADAIQQPTLRAVVMAVMLAAAALPADAQTTRLYDAQGRYVGRAEAGRDGATRFFDVQGRARGASRGSLGSGAASIYDAQGRFRGQVRRTP